MNSKELEFYKKAGTISIQAKEYARSIIKKGIPLLEIANRIEAKIEELGGKPAFPVNLSINEIAAHYTPSWNDVSVAEGLLKVDIGVHINGYAADTAFSLDLEGKEENEKLIQAAEEGLNSAIQIIKNQISLKEVGTAIEKAIKSKGFQPIQNLSGHSIERWNLHAGITVPNISNSSPVKIDEGVYAIEPFATTGLGAVRDGRPSGIYHVEDAHNVRDQFAREVLEYLIKEYQTLPFCSRWIYKKYNSRGLLALRRLEEAGVLHHYPQLVEISGAKVAQAENTVIITSKEKIVTTSN